MDTKIYVYFIMADSRNISKIFLNIKIFGRKYYVVGKLTTQKKHLRFVYKNMTNQSSDLTQDF